MHLPDAAAAEIARMRIATVTPLGNQEWLLSSVEKVGVVRLGSVELRIEPKVPLHSLFFLLSRTLEWNNWREEEVTLDSVTDLYPAIAELFARASERVLRDGILRSYREHRAAESTVRGRWLVAEQLRRRHGLPLPAELAYDDFTSDIDENRMLRSAARRLLRLPNLAAPLRKRLYRIDAELADAEVLTRGVPLPQPHFDRRNRRYRTALGFARLILEDASLERGLASITGSGFLLTMSSLFERFIGAEIARATASYGGTIQSQRRDYLDRDDLVLVKPDLVWLRDRTVAAVFDAKYKAEKPAGYPNADIYQMLAYCIRHGVSEGHLIYAAGNGTPQHIVTRQSNVTIVCHAIALDEPPAQIMRQIDKLVQQAVG
ncbi:restriction endonuclease [Rathayibacter sp. AY1A2]|nr:restriction endonuclease [Rathayibacter sp. AY1A2]